MMNDRHRRAKSPAWSLTFTNEQPTVHFPGFRLQIHFQLATSTSIQRNSESTPNYVFRSDHT
uniref:Uncharacterized protein n=1 Tax=Anguilla anguilla TaxID=7936 RepID=A0A0E9R4A5_ANGAN